MTAAALEQAITFLSRTDLIAAARLQALPEGVTELLKISSGDQAALLTAQESSRHSQEDVRHAAQFYVQQILFAPDSDHYRVLGVDPDDVESKLKLHYRLLVRWLHPDKNSSDWEAVFSDRINRAWHALRTPERRLEYDDALASQNGSLSPNTLPSRELQPVQWRQASSHERFMSARTIKRLPMAVFAMLGITAIFALWWFSQLQPQLQTVAVNNPEPESKAMESPAAESFAYEAVAQVPNEPPMPEAMAAPAITETAEAALTEISALPVKSNDVIKAATAVSQPELVEAEVSKIIKPASTPIIVKANTSPIEKPSVNPKIKPTALIANNETKSIQPAAQKARNPTIQEAHPPVVTMLKIDPPVSTSRTAESNSDELALINQYDSDVKQFVQQFSQVYSDGNYFALHNLFTRDLDIIGASAQRKVLHGYRELFESSKSRQIALQQVTWLNNDGEVIVKARYETQVLPLGKNETQSKRGDIRLDLRMEDGELKIIHVQSDSKNG